LAASISLDVFVIDWMAAEMIDSWDEILPEKKRGEIRRRE